MVLARLAHSRAGPRPTGTARSPSGSRRSRRPTASSFAGPRSAATRRCNDPHDAKQREGRGFPTASPEAMNERGVVYTTTGGESHVGIRRQGPAAEAAPGNTFGATKPAGAGWILIRVLACGG